jgi:hypothetical protein
MLSVWHHSQCNPGRREESLGARGLLPDCCAYMQSTHNNQVEALVPLDFPPSLCYNWGKGKQEFSKTYMGRKGAAMNIWDSVHRGLEKASHEAARVARAQRLRATIDSLSRQINTQQSTLLATTMEVFSAGNLTQSELIPLCRELAGLQQQLSQAQNELKQLHSQGAKPPVSPSPASVESSPTLYAAPPEYPAYDQTIPATPPPPPPGVEPLTISSLETAIMGLSTPSPVEKKQYCSNCRTEVLPGHVYCQNCGTPVQNSNISHLPTVRGSAPDSLHSTGQETVRSDTLIPTEYQETVRGEPPSTTDLSQALKDKDGGQ